ncbi:MAG: hypothetical protein GY822_31390 [Deltaproteobacteria bacterium]|nr:hypothetical protein [Deltaproteobacteria bacterium]
MSTSSPPSHLESQTPKREDAEHQPYFCEENIWRWVQRDDVKNLSGLRNLQVLFISGNGEAFVMGEQRAGKGEFGVVTWDYHVVAAGIFEEQWCIFDLDTRLPFPCSAKRYLDACFYPSLCEEWLPSFRHMSSEAFVEIFQSDRGHMKDDSGLWRAPPPSWPPPSTKGNNIGEFADMTEETPGQVLSLQETIARFSNVPRASGDKNDD